MALQELKRAPDKMAYQGYEINLYPYAGGFKSYIFAPGECAAMASTVMVGPDGTAHLLQRTIIQESKDLIDGDIAARSGPAPRDEHPIHAG